MKLYAALAGAAALILIALQITDKAVGPDLAHMKDKGKKLRIDYLRRDRLLTTAPAPTVPGPVNRKATKNFTW